MLAFLATLEQIAHANVELSRILQIIQDPDAGPVERQVFPISEERRIGTQICRHFLRLVLLDRRSRREQIVILPQRKLDRLIQRDTRGRRSLRTRTTLPRSAKNTAVMMTFLPHIQSGTLSVQLPPPAPGGGRRPWRSRHKTSVRERCSIAGRKSGRPQ